MVPAVPLRDDQSSQAPPQHRARAGSTACQRDDRRRCQRSAASYDYYTCRRTNVSALLAQIEFEVEFQDFRHRLWYSMVDIKPAFAGTLPR